MLCNVQFYTIKRLTQSTYCVFNVCIVKLIISVIFITSLFAVIQFPVSANTRIEPLVQWYESSVIREGILSPSGKLVLYIVRGKTDGDGVVILRDLIGGEVQCAWDSQGTATYVAFSASGNELAIELSQQKAGRQLPSNYGKYSKYVVNVFSSQHCKLLYQISPKIKGVRSVDFTNDGKYIIGTAPPKIFVVPTAKPSTIRWINISPSRDIRWLSLFENNKRLLALETSPSYVTIYDASDDLLETKGLTVRPRGTWRSSFWVYPDVSWDENRIVYVSDIGNPYEVKDANAVVRDISTLEVSHTWSVGGGFESRAVLFFPNSSALVLTTSCSGIVRVYELLPNELRLLSEKDIRICPSFHSTSFTQDGKYFLVIGESLNEDENDSIALFESKELFDDTYSSVRLE